MRRNQPTGTAQRSRVPTHFGHGKQQGEFCPAVLPNIKLRHQGLNESVGQLDDLRNPRVKYVFEPQVLSLGQKRNLAAQTGSGDVIAVMDDDDFYAPKYLTSMVNSLLVSGAGLAKLTAWHDYGESYKGDRRHHSFMWQDFSEGDRKDGWGWTLTFTRDAFEKSGGYDDVDFNEDGKFIRKIKQAGFSVHYISDAKDWALRIVTGSIMRFTGRP